MIPLGGKASLWATFKPHKRKGVFYESTEI